MAAASRRGFPTLFSLEWLTIFEATPFLLVPLEFFAPSRLRTRSNDLGPQKGKAVRPRSGAAAGSCFPTSTFPVRGR